MYYHIDELRSQVHAEIKRRWSEFVTKSTANANTNYRRLTKHSETYVERPFSICDLLRQRLVLTRRGQPVPSPKFKQGGRLGC